MRRPPEHFGPEPEVVPEENIAAKAGIGASGERLRHVGRAAVKTAAVWGIDRADTESDVDFLSLGEIREGGQGGAGKGHEYDHSNCAFHAKPPRDFWLLR